MVSVSYTHLDVYKRQAGRSGWRAGYERVLQVGFSLYVQLY